MLIALDQPSTWPTDAIGVLQKGLPTLRLYQEQRLRIHRHCLDNAHNILLRINPTINPFRAERDAVMENVAARIAGADVMAWHCTRLCDDEVAAVRDGGMYPLSPNTFEARVQRRVDAGDITFEMAARLRAKNMVGESNRSGQFWFVCTRDLLLDGGVNDLFTFWGGESLYNSHDRDELTGPILRRLGRPRIVEFTIPGNHFEPFNPFELTMTRVFELMHGMRDENRPACQGYTRLPIGPGQIRRIISADEAGFREMVGSETIPALGRSAVDT